nr:MAG: major capsid protein [Gokushovirinae sp.]
MEVKGKIPSRVINNSNILPQVNANLSTFDLSESLVTTIKPDYLYPVFWQELQPNDHFEISVSSLARIMPMVAPTMTGIKMKFFAFWVPNRILWNHWLNFMGEKTFQGDKTEYTVPQIKMKDTTNITGGIADYLGIPPTETNIDYSVSAFPFRAYNKIWNEWFRANMIQEEVKEYSGDTTVEEKLSEYKLLKKGKPLDYFTSCLPQPLQVDIAIGESAPVLTGTKITRLNFGAMDQSAEIIDNRGGAVQTRNHQAISANTETNLYADMSQVTGLSIESLRKAASLQVLLEKDQRSGQRYIDLLHEHFGISVPDFLVGRSEFIGSCTTNINVEPVVQNSETSLTPQGNLTSVGFGLDNDKLCEFSAREHGHLMILCSVESEVLYQQGLDRKFSKLGRFDYYFPEFSNLGEQPVLEKEIMLTPETANSLKVFGYTPRYRELREGYNKVSGLMRSNVTSGKQSLDVWHLAQKFENVPQLNAEFIESKTPLERVLAIQEDDSLVLNCYFDVKATRSVPIQANPSILAGRV